jgi:hypothetical protein
MSTHRSTPAAVVRIVGALALLGAAGVAVAHGISGDDQAFLLRATGPQLGPFVYLGAKHMVTGYDHLFFLAGVIFFLYRLKDVAVYVTLFAIGHSATLLLGVLGGLHVNAYIVDAIIGLSVVYKGLDNIGAFRSWFGFQPDTRAATLIFGFFHGFGLATKLQDLALSPDGLVVNMVSFNVGVEIGQLLALGLMLVAFNVFRASGQFLRLSFAANVALMCAGFVLIGYQLTGYALS